MSRLGSAPLVLAILAAGAAPPTANRTNPRVEAGFHAGRDRAGAFIVPRLNPAATAPALRFRAQMTGWVNVQPLYWRPRGARHGLLFVASEKNEVAALDAVTGQALWRVTLGPPGTRQDLCGNIDPVGVSATGVLDPAHRVLYLDAVIGAAHSQRQYLVALSMTDGHMLPGYPLPIGAGVRALGGQFDDLVEQNRVALTRLGGRVYVAFGGYSGDCGPYHGVVVGIDTGKAPRVAAYWSTAAVKGGIWNPAGIVSDGTSLYVATGNTEHATTWGGGEAVLRLSRDLKPRDYFVPENWQKLDTGDLDLGGVNPTLIDAPHTPTPKLLLALGKDGAAYLLNRRHLGGISQPLAKHDVSPDPIRSATAKFRLGKDTMVVVNAHSHDCAGMDGIVALRVHTDRHGKPAVSTAWCHEIDGRGAPIVTVSARGGRPVVWIFGAEGDERLRAYDGATGAVLYVSDPTPAPVPHFSAPLVAEDRLYLPARNGVLAFKLHRVLP